MARLLTLVASFALLSAAWAQEKPLTAQQERMQSCNAQASNNELKGDERQAFMSSCLKGESGGRKLTAQQERMRTCNAQASRKELKGNEREEFMSRCLKAEAG
jgi:psiF repeat